ncbi:MAG: hypothetical protein QOF01_394 [Thermomicrobiales bacterium]|nr:hypothetical protein [Thermomicrobiales bacterium]
MLLGLTLPRMRLGGPISRSYDRPRQWHDPARRWHAERGEILFEASCDVVGGFPGFAALGGRLDDVRLRVTERYLLVGDGDDLGFGFPIRLIEGIAFVPVSEDDEYGLRVFYQDGVSPRLFTVRFHGNRLSMRGGSRAARAHLSLLRVGLDDRFAVSPPPDPNFMVSWDQTAEFEAENVIWTGQAAVPRLIGLESVPGNVWLTTRSLIWGCESVAGVHRVPLSLLSDVAAATLADRAATPALYVGLGDETTGHFDLAFLFDRQSTSDHNLRERGALLVGLRSRGVPVGTPTPPFQPWRLAAHLVGEDTGEEPFVEVDEDEMPASLPIEAWEPRRPVPLRRLDSCDLPAGVSPHPAWAEQPVGFDAPVVPESPETKRAGGDTDDRMEAPDEPSPLLLDVVLAEWSALPEEDDDRRDVQLAASWISPASPAVYEEPVCDPARLKDDCPPDGQVGMRSPAIAAQAPDTDVPSDVRPGNSPETSVLPTVVTPSIGLNPPDGEQRTGQTTASVCWPRVAAYESAAVGALADIIAAIRDRVTGKTTPLTTTLPTSADQSAALAELTGLNRKETVTPEELFARSARILALGDACIRLHTLLELRDAGHLSDADLARLQQTITAQLAGVMEVR